MPIKSYGKFIRDPHNYVTDEHLQRWYNSDLAPQKNKAQGMIVLRSGGKIIPLGFRASCEYQAIAN
ncbi:MAG: hypothetical protein VKL39_19180 [Leptolyngbyaceae bacterium]|nr:hypothetical protein [Leptolyngbyaceae bacterium]